MVRQEESISFFENKNQKNFRSGGTLHTHAQNKQKFFAELFFKKATASWSEFSMNHQSIIAKTFDQEGW